MFIYKAVFVCFIVSSCYQSVVETAPMVSGVDDFCGDISAMYMQLETSLNDIAVKSLYQLVKGQ